MSGCRCSGNFLSAVLAIAFSTASVAQGPLPLKDLDTNGDTTLSVKELESFFLEQDPECAAESDEGKRFACAELRAEDFISANAPFATGSPGVSIEVAQVHMGLYLQERAAVVLAARRAEQEKQGPRAYGWRVNRTISDPAWFSAWKEDRPFVLSFKHDNLAADGAKRDQFVVLGSVGYEFEPRTLRRGSQRSIAVGIEVDSDSSKAASESSVSLVVPVQWSWALTKPGALVDGLALKIQPKVVTDRHFDREVLAADMTLSVAADSAAIGYIAWTRGWRRGATPFLSFHWNPTLTFQALRVEDAAGSAKLAVHEDKGVGFRAIPRVQMSFGFPRTDGRLTVSLDGRVIWDDETNEALGFGEGNVGFKLSRFADISLIYRRGYKGDDLTKVDEMLVGIGVQFGK